MQFSSSRRVPARWLGLFAALVFAWTPGLAAADAADVAFEVSIVRVSPEPGGVQANPGAKRFDKLLGKKIRYESLQVLDTVRRTVAIDRTETVSLPNGRKLRFRPLDPGPKGVLVAVDLDETAQGDFRIPEGKPLILGGQPYDGGQLFVVLEVKN